MAEKKRYIMCPFPQSRDDGIEKNLHGLIFKIVKNHESEKVELKYIRLNNLNPNISFDAYREGRSYLRKSQLNECTLQEVEAGSVIYVIAHGNHENCRLGSMHTDKKKFLFLFTKKKYREITTDDFVQLLVDEGLPDGETGNETRIRLIICNAGGEKMDEELVKLIVGDGFRNNHEPLDYDKYGNADATSSIKKYINEKNETIASLIARRLGEKNYKNILVGGYPGELSFQDGKACLYIQFRDGSYSCPVQNAMLWFDCSGQWVIPSRREGATHASGHSSDG